MLRFPAWDAAHSVQKAQRTVTGLHDLWHPLKCASCPSDTLQTVSLWVVLHSTTLPVEHPSSKDQLCLCGKGPHSWPWLLTLPPRRSDGGHWNPTWVFSHSSKPCICNPVLSAWGLREGLGRLRERGSSTWLQGSHHPWVKTPQCVCFGVTHVPISNPAPTCLRIH